jgi:coenzyme F420-reducing hydrogenase delta subunit
MNDNTSTPEIVLLYCPRTISAGTDPSPSWLSKHASGANVRPASIPCGSAVQVPHLLKILEDGADAVVVLTCGDEVCQSLTGSARAEKRVAYARHLLDGFGLGADRLGIHHGNNLSDVDLVDLCRNRAVAVASLGPHPMKIRLKETTA